jgi:hypothetical protein
VPESKPDVVELSLESIEPAILLLPQVRLGLLGELEEVLSVPAPDLVGFTARNEPVERELADRLVHPVPVVGAADEALLDKGSERVDVGVDQLLGALQRATACEDS